MITRVRVKNYRSIADVDIELGPLTVLVGCNGVGKSMFVDVLRFVRDALRLGLDSAITQRHGITSLRRWSPQGRPFDVEITLTIQEQDLWGEYSFVIGSKQQGEYRVKREICQVGRTQRSTEYMFETKDGKWIKQFPLREDDSLPQRTGRLSRPIEPTSLVLSASRVFGTPRLLRLYQSLSYANFYTIFPNTLREPQKPSNEYPLLEHGENLASALRQLKKQDSSFPELLTALNRVVGSVSDIRVRQVGGFLVTELKHEAQSGRAPWFELAQESDGTLRTLGLLVALYQRAPSTLIAIEEPELTLHPGALGVLSDVLREAAKRRQVIITTQSPDLISRFGADELRVVERVNGVTKIGPIDETQRKVINDQLFSAGDLLRIEGLHRAPVEAAGGGHA